MPSLLVFKHICPTLIKDEYQQQKLPSARSLLKPDLLAIGINILRTENRCALPFREKFGLAILHNSFHIKKLGAFGCRGRLDRPKNDIFNTGDRGKSANGASGRNIERINLFIKVGKACHQLARSGLPGPAGPVQEPGQLPERSEPWEPLRWEPAQGWGGVVWGLPRFINAAMSVLVKPAFASAITSLILSAIINRLLSILLCWF